MIRKLNFARDSRNCVVVRSRGADSVLMEGRSSKFLRELMFDEFFKCRTEYRTLKYEHVKKYIFKRVKN